MEGKEGRKAFGRALVNSALQIEDEFGNILKLSCDDHVENTAALVTDDAAFGTNAEVDGGSIFKNLAGRKALKCPHVEDLVNSASASTGQVKEKRLRLCVGNPNSSSATTTGIKAKARRPSAYPAGYAFIEYPYANVYGAGIPYEEFLEGGRVVAKIASCCYEDRDPHPKVTSERRPIKYGVQPPVPDISYKECPFYKAAVASGAKIVVNGHKWKATLKADTYFC